MLFQLIILVIIAFIPAVYCNMCIDAGRRLRCVFPENCPSKRAVDHLECPTTRVCCRNYRTSVGLPLRSVGMTRTLTDTTRDNPTTLLTLTDEIVFPSETPDNAPSRTERPWKYGFPKRAKNGVHSQLENEQLFKMSKSDYYCEKYTELTTKPGHFPFPIPKERFKDLVLENLCPPSFTPLIVGGTNANIGEFPHMAALGYNKTWGISYICGGTLISDDFILTAAHCIQTNWGPPVQVFLGHLTLRSKHGVVAAVDESIAHPGYQPPSLYHDIALLRLAKKLKLSISLRPACLPSRLDEKRKALENPGAVTVATGWGRTGVIAESSQKLKKVRLEVVDNAKCNEFYEIDSRTFGLRNGITSDMICAGGQEKLFDTCQGDSGGPLQAFIPGKNCVIEVLGVTSFGKSCGIGVPGVYTKVSSYVSWIESYVWP